MSELHPPLFTPNDIKLKNVDFTGVDGLQYIFDFDEKKWKISDLSYDEVTISSIIKDMIIRYPVLTLLTKNIIHNPYIFPGVYIIIESTKSYSKYSQIFTSSENYIQTLVLKIIDFYKVDIIKTLGVKINNDKLSTALENRFYPIIGDNDENLLNFYQTQQAFKIKINSSYSSIPIILFIINKLFSFDLTSYFNKITLNPNNYGEGKLNRLSIRRKKITNGELTKLPILDDIIISHILLKLSNKEYMRFSLINKYYRKLLLNNNNKILINILHEKFKNDNAFELVMNNYPELIKKYSLENNVKMNGWKFIHLPGSLNVYLDLGYELTFSEAIYIINNYNINYEKLNLNKLPPNEITIIHTYINYYKQRI